MKKLFTMVYLMGLSLLMAPLAQAAPFAAADKNPQVVAFYESGPHGIVGENELHTGIDLVMRMGKSGGFQQWFFGTSASEGEHGEHSVWKIKKHDECSKNSDLVVDPHPEWGDYLTVGVDYCVKTNDFRSSSL